MWRETVPARILAPGCYAACRQTTASLEGGLIIVHSQRELLYVVAALHSSGRFAGRLNRWQEQAYQDANNGDYHQQLY